MIPPRLVTALAAASAALAACGSEDPEARRDRPAVATTATAAGFDPRAAVPVPDDDLPFLAVNSLDALLPLAPTRGRLAASGGCVTFKVRDQLYTPVWPTGSRLSADGKRVLGPRGESFALGEDATLPGASFSLAGMRLERPLARDCPAATYAVNL
jgi:hypothetical protein